MDRGNLSKGVLLAAVVLLAVLVASATLLAQEGGDAYVGTYRGTATGSGGGSAIAVSVWLEDLGEEARVTARADESGITLDAIGRKQASVPGGVEIPVAVQKMGIDATGRVTARESGDGWELIGSGSGTVLGSEGGGEVRATRVSAGVRTPGLAEQVTDVFTSFLSFGTGEDSETDEAPEEADSTETSAERDGSPLAPARTRPPVPTDDALVAVGLMALLLFLEVMSA